jgi:hypothetical protein
MQEQALVFPVDIEQVATRPSAGVIATLDGQASETKLMSWICVNLLLCSAEGGAETPAGAAWHWHWAGREGGRS